ncbi:MAG: HAD-IG family 5'-nucleotidase [Polyangiaceae bacterium]
MAEQLALPLVESEPDKGPARLVRPRRVFVNRNLKMATIDWIGFDMDYTLAIYNQAEMDNLSIRATVDKLCARGYPEDVLGDIAYPIEFPIRGLLIDKKHGHILKMDRFKVVQKGYHGLRELSKEELRELYASKKIRPTTGRYHWIDTLYALSEATAYVAIVDGLERRKIPVDYGQLFADIREAIDEAHRDGTILDTVMSDLPRFVERDPALAQTLHKLRSAGKRLFLLTNSRWPYTEKMMDYLLGGAMPEYPSFRHYFDVVVVAALKPALFRGRRPLCEASGQARGEGGAEGEPRLAGPHLERGVVYEGGNLHDLERALGCTGDRILYVGDHIYGDILRSKKESAWRTAMIIQEMEAEVLAHESCRAEIHKSAELLARREELEDQLRYWQQRFKDLSRKPAKNGHALPVEAENGPTQEVLAGFGIAPGPPLPPREANGKSSADATPAEIERTRVKRSVERIRGQLRAVDAEAHALERAIDRRFHPYWGSLLKESSETSSFGDQVEEYACIYTSRVSNLLSYSPLQYFRSPRELMPHEL